MKHTMSLASLALIATLAVVCGTAFAQAPKAQDPELAQLRRDIARLEAEIVLLKEASVEGAVPVQEIIEYLHAQAKSAEALQSALSEANEEGFAWGINPKAHELVLTGLNGVASSLQRGLPKPVGGDEEQN